MTVETITRIPPPRRFTLSWICALAFAAEHTPIFVTHYNELLQVLTNRAALGIDGGD